MMQTLLLSVLTMCACAAQAAPGISGEDATAQGNTVVIRRLRHPEAMAYANFIAARKAYESYRRFAPDAPLLFQVKTRSGNLDGLHVNIEGDNTSIPVVYDEHGQFTLPYSEQALRDKALVTSDIRRGEVYWLPVVRSPGVPPSTLRLGDLRLFCRLQWALEEGDASLATRLMTLARGNCESSSFITMALPEPGMRVRLVSGERQEMLGSEGEKNRYVAHRTRWEPPFGDASWPDDTRIEFLPPEEGFALSEECRQARGKVADGAYRHSYGTFSRDSCVWRPH